MFNGDVYSQPEIQTNNNHVYVSTKGNDGVILVYDIENDLLIKIQEYPLYCHQTGSNPTSIAVKDNILIAVDAQNSIVEIATIDKESGMLTAGD